MAETINTPFGKIDLTPHPISFWIEDSSIGAKRRVDFEGIQAQSEDQEVALITWKVWQFEQDGETLINQLDAVQGRVVTTPVIGYNRVSSEGLLIMRESFPEGEVGDRAYQMAYSKGHNEYRYWMALLRIAPLPIVLQSAGSMLAQFHRFERK
jgi:hypothetical protein